MKKKKFTIAILVSILTLFILTGCGNKKVISAETFERISKRYDNEVTDRTELYKANENITKNLISRNKEDWEVEFYTLNNIENAKDMFNINKQYFKEEKKGSSSESSSSSNNYETYTLISNGYFMHICRIDNTFLYTKVKKENKDAVKKLIKKLGY